MMNAVLKGVAIAYVAFSAVCVISAVLAYFDIGLTWRRRG